MVEVLMVASRGGVPGGCSILYLDDWMITVYSLRMLPKAPIPVVDLFAGPGGLGEGFSRVKDVDGRYVFKTVVSIEKDMFARQTLRLRAFYRMYRMAQKELPSAYFDLLEATKGEERNAALDALAREEAWKVVCDEVPEWEREGKFHCELGPENVQIYDIIRQKLKDTKRWVLIGGPPCQAYSLVGRSRMKNHDGKKEDPRHFLYREYLGVIKEFKPTLFVMENVKGLNTAKVNGKPILPLIKSAGYVLKAIVKPKNEDDFMVESECYGIPQTRHRVIIIGIKKSESKLSRKLKPLAECDKQETVYNAISGLPRLMALNSARSRDRYKVSQKGAPCRHISYECRFNSVILRNFISSISTPVSGLLLNHEARSHMKADLKRYKWWARNATESFSPKLDGKIPKSLLPNHNNSKVEGASAFADRFKVQVSGRPSGTITSHISKDGHYYIHYDPSQARSFSVREAARIQTFPDDYFFMGNRTQQYHQVGNAVPPYLAYQIGEIIAKLLGR